MMCQPCAEASNKWLDYRIKPSFQIHQVDDTARGVNDKRKRRFEDWRDLIKTQQAMIADQCKRKHQEGT